MIIAQLSPVHYPFLGGVRVLTRDKLIVVPWLLHENPLESQNLTIFADFITINPLFYNDSCVAAKHWSS